MITVAVVLGLVLGGSYALLALGLTLQYGIARILNLAHGEFTLGAAFILVLLFQTFEISPLLSILLIGPVGYAVGWVLYTVMMQPLVRRTGGGGKLEVGSILVTFGLLFVLQGIFLISFGADFTSISYLSDAVNILGVPVTANRLVSFGICVIAGGALILALRYTTWGLIMRAVSQTPKSAPLVGINVNKYARQGFALGTALAATGGASFALYRTFTATDGMIYTMTALVIVIMGGVGNVTGAILAGMMLGLVQTFVSTMVDPGLTLASTYLIFLAVLLWRPQGLFG